MLPEKVNCHPDQWRDINYHHQRATHVFGELYLSGALIKSDSLTISETRLAVSYHDIGKALVPNHIHQATKDPHQQAYYEAVYRFHPAATLAILGRSFIQEHPLGARIIYFHHPDQPVTTSRTFLGLTPQPPQTKQFRWGLAALILADGITSGWEIRYGRTQSEKQEATIKILQHKLGKNGLSGNSNIPLAVDIGYKALNQLGI